MKKILINGKLEASTVKRCAKARGDERKRRGWKWCGEGKVGVVEARREGCLSVR